MTTLAQNAIPTVCGTAAYDTFIVRARWPTIVIQDVGSFFSSSSRFAINRSTTVSISSGATNVSSSLSSCLRLNVSAHPDGPLVT